MQHSIHSKIAKKRLEKNFSQQYMASQLSISQSYYNKIENGKKELSISRVLHISEILNINIIELLNSENNISV